MNGVVRRAYAGLVVMAVVVAFAQPAVAQSIVQLGQWTNGPCRSLASEGELVCVGNGEALELMTVDPAGAVTLRGRVVLGATIQGIDLADSLVVVACGEAGLKVVSIADPGSPILLGVYETAGDVRDVATDGTWAYLADHDVGLLVIDLSVPSAPDVAETVVIDRGLSALDLEGDYLYVGDTSGDLAMFSVLDPRHPLQTDLHGDSGDVYDIAIAGGRAYLAQGAEGLLVIDVSNPDQIDDLGRLPLQGPWAFGVAVAGERAYVAAAAAGLMVIDIAVPAQMSVLGSLGTGGYAYDTELVSGHALLADSWTGVRLIDVGEDAAPLMLDTILMQANSSRVAYDDSLAVVADADSSLRVLDLSQPALPREIGSLFMPEIMNVDIVGAVAVAACNRYGLTVIDLGDPYNPVVAATFDTPGLALDVCLLDGFAWVADGDSGLYGVDVLTPGTPPVVVQMSVGTDIAAVDARDGRLVLGDRGGQVHVVDVSTPAAPQLVGSAPLIGQAVGIAFGAGVVLVACGDDGLRIHDLQNESTPTEITSVDPGHAVLDVAALQGHALLAADAGGLYIYNVHTPSDPFLIGQFGSQSASGVVALPQHILLADGYGGLLVLYTELAVSMGISDFTARRLDAAVRLDWHCSESSTPVIVSRLDETGAPQWLGVTERTFWLDESAPIATGTYRLRAPSSGRILVEAAVGEASTTRCELSAPVPNPANPGCEIRFSLALPGRVRLEICDLRGRRLARLVDGSLPAGDHGLTWDGRDQGGRQVASGSYLLRLVSGDDVRWRRLQLVR